MKQGGSIFWLKAAVKLQSVICNNNNSYPIKYYCNKNSCIYLCTRIRGNTQLLAAAIFQHQGFSLTTTTTARSVLRQLSSMATIPSNSNNSPDKELVGKMKATSIKKRTDEDFAHGESPTKNNSEESSETGSKKKGFALKVPKVTITFDIILLLRSLT